MLVGAAVIINSIIMDIIQGSMEVVPLEMPTLEEEVEGVTMAPQI